MEDNFDKELIEKRVVGYNEYMKSLADKHLGVLRKFQNICNVIGNLGNLVSEDYIQEKEVPRMPEKEDGEMLAVTMKQCGIIIGIIAPEFADFYNSVVGKGDIESSEYGSGALPHANKIRFRQTYDDHDIFTLLHEFGHLLNQRDAGNPRGASMLRELPSLLLELLPFEELDKRNLGANREFFRLKDLELCNKVEAAIKLLESPPPAPNTDNYDECYEKTEEIREDIMDALEGSRYFIGTASAIIIKQKIQREEISFADVVNIINNKDLSIAEVIGELGINDSEISVLIDYISRNQNTTIQGESTNESVGHAHIKAIVMKESEKGD